MQHGKRPFITALIAMSLFFNTSCFTLVKTQQQYVEKSIRTEHTETTTYTIEPSSVQVDEVAEVVYFTLQENPSYHNAYRHEEHLEGNEQLGAFAFAGYLAAIVALALAPSLAGNQGAPPPFNNSGITIGALLAFCLGDYLIASSAFKNPGDIRVLGTSEEDEKERTVDKGNWPYLLYSPETKETVWGATDESGRTAVHVTWFDAEADGFHMKTRRDMDFFVLPVDAYTKSEILLVLSQRAERLAALQRAQEAIWREQQQQAENRRAAELAIWAKQKDAYCNMQQIIATTFGATVEELAKGQLDKAIARRANISESNAGRVRNFIETYAKEGNNTNALAMSAFKNEFDNKFKDLISDNKVLAELGLQTFYASLPCLLTLFSTPR